MGLAHGRLARHPDEKVPGTAHATSWGVKSGECGDPVDNHGKVFDRAATLWGKLSTDARPTRISARSQAAAGKGRQRFASTGPIGHNKPMTIDRNACAHATRHLKREDPTLGRVIQRIGPCTLRTRRDRFASLVQSIISQQVSTQAAATIGQRLAIAAGGQIGPETLAELSDQQMRAAGISPQKLRYMRDLCAHTADGRLQLARLGYRSDAEVIAALTQVLGIGVWTAQMFLIFVLGRADVLPCGDLGIQNAMRNLYGLAERPTPAAMESIARPWHPYASIGSWYCWRSLD